MKGYNIKLYDIWQVIFKGNIKQVISKDILYLLLEGVELFVENMN